LGHAKGYQAEVPQVNPMGPPLTVNFLLLSVAARFWATAASNEVTYDC